LGQVFHPELAALWGWHAVPYVTVAVCSVCWLLIAMGYQAPGQEREAKREGRQGTGGLSWPIFGLVTLAGLAWTFMNVGYLVYLSFAPIGMIEHGETPVGASWIASLASWAMLVSIPACGWLADKTGRSTRSTVRQTSKHYWIRRSKPYGSTLDWARPR
jgi:MFS family permease